MSRTTFHLILLVSCAHTLVHVFELALPSSEQMIAADFHVGKEQTGMLGTAWRIPFGVGAVLTGWLVDRYGSKRLLLIYLAGCAATCLWTYAAQSLRGVFFAMLTMGCFASIYHPAGLALISHVTTPATRGAALGWHGIFGSAGIAGAPFLAGVVFTGGDVSWRQYYLLLSLPAMALMVILSLRMREDHIESSPAHRKSQEAPTEDAPHRWRMYGVLVTTGVLSGFIYAAFMHFLPRYLSDVGVTSSGVSDEGLRNRLAALVLSFGIVGQSVAGRFARPGRLEVQLAVILFASAPLLFWMAFAVGPWRIAATCLLALVHFMNQPIYNSLIPQYVPAARLSLGYGFSNMVCFSIGGLGPAFAGFMQTDRWTYGGLAVVAVLAGTTSLLLIRRVDAQPT